MAIREPVSLDPAFLANSNDFTIAVNVHEGLFSFEPETGKAIPGLALEYTVDESQKVWTFRLREAARYNDGTLVQADDFVFAWNRLASPSTASPGADAVYIIRGGKEIASGGTAVLGVEALDERTLRVELAEPQPFLPSLLASPRFAPLPRSHLSTMGQDVFRSSRPVSTGLYQVQEWAYGRKLVLVPNPYHRNSSKGCFNRVVLHFSDSEETALKWFETGRVDLVIGLVPLGRIARLKGEYGRQVVELPMRSVFYFILNLRNPTLEPLEVRRALFAGLDRGTLVRRVLGAGQQEGWGFIPPYYEEGIGYRAPMCPMPPSSWKRPSAGARAALSGAELTSNSSESLKAILEFVQQNLLKETGIFLSIRLMEWNSFLASLKKGDFVMSRLSLTGGPDPVDFLDNFTSGHPNNYSGFSNPEYDALVQQVHREAAIRERFRAMDRAHKILCQELPAIPVYFSSQVHLVREPHLTWFKSSPEAWTIWRTTQ